jgi:hypothetical protein
MPRTPIATIALGSVALVLFATAAACELEFRRLPALSAGLEPLRVPMAEGGPTRASFQAVWSEPHYVALIFADQQDPETTDLLAQAGSAMGISGTKVVQFDFEWRALEGTREVGRGSGHNGPAGSFSGSEHGLLFGEFPVRAGRTYDVELRPSAGFERWASAKPLLAVGVNVPGPSVSLPWVQALNRPVAGILAALGLLFLGGAIWTIRK